MKLPNGYGSVTKTSGKRRNPWVVRKTDGYTLDPEKGTKKQNYIIIGYAPTSRTKTILAPIQAVRTPSDSERCRSDGARAASGRMLTMSAAILTD